MPNLFLLQPMQQPFVDINGKRGIDMNLQINSKNYTLKGYMKDEIEKSLSKLDKFFTEDSSANLTVNGRKNGYKVDLTVNARNHILKSEIEDRDLNTAVDKTVAKMERQLEKHKTKLRRRNNDSIRYENLPATDENDVVYNIVKNKTFKLTPMTPEEACFQLELLEHEFYVFENTDNNQICVVYKRADGDYGIIEPSK